MKTPIAELELTLIYSSGKRSPVRVQVGQPQADRMGMWTCSVELSFNGVFPSQAYGENSLQVLCQALHCVSGFLESLTEDGDRLVCGKEDADFRSEDYFGIAAPKPDAVDDSTPFKTGALRLSEWQGFWKATPETSSMTGDEWDAAWNSFNSWLRQRYAVDWSPEKERHLVVEGDYSAPERTLKVNISVADVMTLGFLRFVQGWLRRNAPLWRVSIPIDNTLENQIMIYPEEIRANPEAEADWGAYLERMRPRLAGLIDSETEQLGLPRKPIPPFPSD